MVWNWETCGKYHVVSTTSDPQQNFQKSFNPEIKQNPLTISQHNKYEAPLSCAEGQGLCVIFDHDEPPDC